MRGAGGVLKRIASWQITMKPGRGVGDAPFLRIIESWKPPTMYFQTYLRLVLS
jgi:hypothetical protein